ncbi:hypothetical protein TrVE_jg6058 [Triparma verrucosa]|uniref:WW domain-containing protein n=1 Tax=Triparma verrucosa TaxID=1606542 RepID=A0A9W7F1U5_9STRA|nr:hypothetical protein TrVE_jg6058 [Triparma verrucosa]
MSLEEIVPNGTKVKRSFGPLGVYTGVVDGSRLVGSSRLYHVTYSDGDDEELESAILLASIADNQGDDSSTSSEEGMEDKKSILSSAERESTISEWDNVEKWYAYWDADYGRHYYYNPTTEVTQWVMPDNYVAEDGDSESDRPDSKGSPAVDPSLRKSYSQSISDASGEKENDRFGAHSPLVTEATPTGRMATTSASSSSIDEMQMQMMADREKDTTPEILTQGNKFINQRTPTPQISETPPNLLPNDGGIGIRRGKRVSISDEIDYSYGGGPIDVEKEELRSSKIKIAMYLLMMLFAVMTITFSVSLSTPPETPPSQQPQQQQQQQRSPSPVPQSSSPILSPPTSPPTAPKSTSLSKKKWRPWRYDGDWLDILDGIGLE